MTLKKLIEMLENPIAGDQISPRGEKILVKAKELQKDKKLESIWNEYLKRDFKSAMLELNDLSGIKYTFLERIKIAFMRFNNY